MTAPRIIAWIAAAIFFTIAIAGCTAAAWEAGSHGDTWGAWSYVGGAILLIALALFGSWDA